MDIQPQQSISDDQELAKVLAGITAGADGAAPTNLADDLKEEAGDTDAKKKDGNKDSKDSGTESTDVSAQGAAIEVPTPQIDTIEATVATEESVPSLSVPSPAADSGLETIKQDALKELRPLVDKLNISAEEKFDTYLLIIRSTDDSSLVAPAFAAARAIADEAGKAQALFEIVKEIDYLSNPQKPTA